MRAFVDELLKKVWGHKIEGVVNAPIHMVFIYLANRGGDIGLGEARTGFNESVGRGTKYGSKGTYYGQQAVWTVREYRRNETMTLELGYLGMRHSRRFELQHVGTTTRITWASGLVHFGLPLTIVSLLSFGSLLGILTF